MRQYDHYIGGASVRPLGGGYFDTVNPYSGEVWARVARGNAADVDTAVAAAKSALNGEWAQLTASQRGRLLVHFSELVEKNAERLAEIEVRDNGKLITEMGSQCRYLAQWYRHYGGIADKIEGAVIPTDKPNVLNYTRYEPLGIVAMITPWNSPLLLLAWKLAAALAGGNVAVIKPSEFTSASTLEFVELFKQAGFPDGVDNVVTGSALKPALRSSCIVRSPRSRSPDRTPPARRFTRPRLATSSR